MEEEDEKEEEGWSEKKKWATYEVLFLLAFGCWLFERSSLVTDGDTAFGLVCGDT